MKAAILILALALPGCAVIDVDNWPAPKWLQKMERAHLKAFGLYKPVEPWVCEVYDSSGTCTKWEMQRGGK